MERSVSFGEANHHKLNSFDRNVAITTTAPIFDLANVGSLQSSPFAIARLLPSFGSSLLYFILGPWVTFVKLTMLDNDNNDFGWRSRR